jgi:hypothetical protein
MKRIFILLICSLPLLSFADNNESEGLINKGYENSKSGIQKGWIATKNGTEKGWEATKNGVSDGASWVGDKSNDTWNYIK